MYKELIQRLRSHNGWALNKTLDEAADAIERLIVFNTMWQCAAEFAKENKPKWIPVTERLPEKDGKYLVCTDLDGYKSLFTSIFRNGDFHLPCVTHWMPLPSEPEPPKED